MSIKFHCEHCGKKIDAPDTAGGKWGKCPACHNKVYVPQLESDEEELKLAPIDETEEERKRRLLAETFQLTQSILQEKEIPDAAIHAQPTQNVTSEKMTEAIVRYLRQMADGDLDSAQRTAETIASNRRKAKEILDQMSTSDPPDPGLQGIPPQVLSGLIRNLRTRLS
ncbi:MAG TPA: hypothetical protein PLU87_00385 [Sedimentisphaerales bacterium]|nr:hypothetical protein [Sedimentisphaerales bacterium]HRS09669.1 hypothetical protein [Sedimentisphaerales bacterium]HRV46350.1 hypothetical protein [Sedimentisphaerales bacterium]